MKKVITLLLAATTVVSAANAQLQKGNVLVGGDIANFSIGLKKGAVTDIHLLPKAAWFINNNVAIGAYVNFELITAKNAGTETIYGVGPLARYYVNSPKVNLLQHGRFFVEGNVGIEGSNTSDGNGNSFNTNGLGLGVGPGYAYFITPNIGLETLLKYNGIVGFGNETTSSKLNLSVGFQVYLPGKGTRDKIMRDEKMK